MKKSALISLLLVPFCLAGCGGSGGGASAPEKYDPLNKDEIKIVVSDLGFGTQQFHAIAQAFEETHPGKNVVVEETVMSSSLLSQLEAGSSIGDVCMFNDDAIWKLWREGLLTNVNDVMSSIPDGESKTLEQKCEPNMIAGYKVDDGNYYSVPFLSEHAALAYNETNLNALLGSGKWELPVTTYEMFKLCDRIKTAGGYGFVWQASYVNLDTWMAQYSGLTEYQHYANGEYYDEADGKWKYSDATLQFFDQNVGYARATNVLQKVIGQYSHQYCNNMTFIYAQSAWAGIPYANDKKLSVFMPNGDWAYNETKEYLDDTKANVGFMKYPIISSVVERLSFYEDGATPFDTLSDAKQGEYDATLQAIVDYVDGTTTTKPTYKGAAISDEDIELIRDRRTYVVTKAQSQAFIPTNSTKKELAKEFLTFMGSNMAIDLYCKNTNGLSPYMTADEYASVSFDNKYMKDVIDVCTGSTSVVHYYKGMGASGYSVPSSTSFAVAFTGGGTAAAFLAKEKAYISSRWNSFLKNAGVNAGDLASNQD